MQGSPLVWRHTCVLADFTEVKKKLFSLLLNMKSAG